MRVALKCLYCLLLTAHCLPLTARAARVPQIAVLKFGRAATQVRDALGQGSAVKLLDGEQVRAAARGAGYEGSLNMTLADARDLGATLGCDFFVLGDAQTLRRTSFAKPLYFEAYASIFLVSTRTGRLLAWDHLSFDGATAVEAEMQLLAEIPLRARRYLPIVINALREEPAALAAARQRTDAAILIDDAPGENEAEANGSRSPRPYRRLRPRYPETAARAEAAATVDVLADIDAQGEVVRVEVVRWGGFGLDEEVVETVKRMHFRPALRDGSPVSVRSLLRYNFRPPPK